jgi:UPF0271 protein
MKRMDLNCDMGELPELIADRTQEALMRCVSSVNVACGGHAGDDATMSATVEQALRAHVAIGAHPGYEDPEHFGRLELRLAADDIEALVMRQCARLEKLAAACGAKLTFVKPHGALYNQAVRDRGIAAAIAAGVKRWRHDVALVGLAGPAGEAMLEEFRAAGFHVTAEAFADRRYEADGSLRSRKFEDSLIHDPAEAARHALRIVRGEGVAASGGAVVPMNAQTLCVHSDTPGAVGIAKAVREALEADGFTVASIPN